jgi:hypothetical protein
MACKKGGIHLLLNTVSDFGIIFVTESMCKEHARYVRDDHAKLGLALLLITMFFKLCIWFKKFRESVGTSLRNCEGRCTFFTPRTLTVYGV